MPDVLLQQDVYRCRIYTVLRLMCRVCRGWNDQVCSACSHQLLDAVGKSAGSVDAFVVSAPAMVATDQNIVLRDGFYQSVLYGPVKMPLQQGRINLGSSSVQ